MRTRNRITSPIQIALSCLLLALTFAGSSTRTARAAANTISIDRATTFQTIWGFGGAANHSAYDLYNKFSAAQQAALLDKLFRTDGNNAGLSMIRLEINPFQTAGQDSTGRNQLTFEPADGVFNWDTDVPQRWMAQEAINRASDVKFYSLPWSPPPWMKTNGSASNGGNLRADMHGKFVDYILLYLDKYINTYGLDIKAISTQNEPTNSTPYASCTYSGASIGTVTSQLIDAVHAQFPGVAVGAPEGATRGITINLLNGMTAAQRAKLDWIPTHDYAHSSGTSLQSYGKPVMNTEIWSEGGEDTSINDSLRWANTIKTALQRNEAGWLFWLILQPIGNGSAEGLVYLHGDGTYSIQRRVYAIGQFSRFMRYGDVRVQASSTNGSLGVVAAKNASGRAAVVVINSSTGAITADVTGLAGSSAHVYRTSTSENMANLADVSVGGGTAANITFAAQSITTLVEVTDGNPTPTPGATPTPTAISTPTATATPVPVGSLHVNAGGPAVSPFVADIDLVGGTAATNWTGGIDTSAVANPAPQAVYQSERYGASTYTFPGYVPGSSQTLRLHFCENYFTAAGKRVFNVSINGVGALTNFDIFATAGAIHKANVQEFTATANGSGQFVVKLTNVTNNALINGIEILLGSATPTATDAATATATSTPTPTPTPAPSIQIDSGGGTVSPFSADMSFAGGTAATNWKGAIDLSAVTSPAPQAVYQTERYGASTYTIPGFAAGSSHIVRLHFCENYFTAAGKRVFNVSINGVGALTNFDIFATAGAIHKANVQEFTATANGSGQFSIKLTNVTNNALINGIEILLGSATPAATDAATATATSAATATPTPTLAPSIQVDSGGGAVSPFAADMNFVGGTAATNWKGAIDVSAVTGPAPSAVYQTERYGASTYTIPGFAAGSSHIVRLHFCENYFTATGKRVFNVSINGTAVLTSLDILATTGSVHKAITRAFSTTANSGGQVVIALTNVTNNALINGIEVN